MQMPPYGQVNMHNACWVRSGQRWQLLITDQPEVAVGPEAVLKLSLELGQLTASVRVPPELYLSCSLLTALSLYRNASATICRPYNEVCAEFHQCWYDYWEQRDTRACDCVWHGQKWPNRPGPSYASSGPGFWPAHTQLSFIF